MPQGRGQREVREGTVAPGCGGGGGGTGSNEGWNSCPWVGGGGVGDRKQ